VRPIVVIAVLLTLACGSQQHKEEKARDELKSWTATGVVLSSNWSQHRVTDAYAKKTIDVAIDSLKGLAEPLQSDEKSKQALTNTTQVYGSLSRAVHNNDREDGARVSHAFVSIHKQLQ